MNSFDIVGRMTKDKHELAEKLKNKGLIFQHTSEELEEITKNTSTLYLGVDPTADSLHVGNLLAFMTVRLFHEYGYKIVILVGGGTATIGDPSGKTEERVLMDEETIDKNTDKLRKQISVALASDDFELVNNKDWLGKISTLDFLRDVGKHFTVNDMLRKESVKRRIEDPDSSISFTEFAYMLLQAYDFYVLHEKFGCDLQLGGSDQWGNITAGVELIRKKSQKTAHGITSPLLLDKTTGRKFGKTEAGTIWLDSKKTSPFQYYQFWYNTDDESAGEYIKYYTLLEEKEIEKIVEKTKDKPEERLVQTTLAFEATKFIHGEESAVLVQNISKALFNNDLSKLSKGEKDMLLEAVPHHAIKKEDMEKGKSYVDILLESELASSKRDARTLLESNAVMIDGVKIEEPEGVLEKGSVKGGISILRKGKRDILLVTIED